MADTSTKIRPRQDAYGKYVGQELKMSDGQRIRLNIKDQSSRQDIFFGDLKANAGGGFDLIQKSIKLDSKLYEAHAGEYEFPDKITIQKEGDRLFTKSFVRGTIELFPESDTKFFMGVTITENNDPQIISVKDEKGQVTHLILHEQGRDIQAKKIK